MEKNRRLWITFSKKNKLIRLIANTKDFYSTLIDKKVLKDTKFSRKLNNSTPKKRQQVLSKMSKIK
jgi:hypothetical protein